MRYYKPKGCQVELFNTEALTNNSKYCVITEGEFDCLSFVTVGVNAIGLSSANNVNKFIEREKSLDKTFILALDNDEAGQIAANYLLDKGYRRIVFLMGDAENDQISSRRLDGINIVFEEEELSIETITGITTYEESRKVTEEILKRDQVPEVILCTNNYLAMGCMQSIRMEKLNIPKDIALMTFDNYPFSMLTEPTLTAIEVDMYEMGTQAARFILQKIKKPNLQTQLFCTTPVLLERDST